MRYEHFKICSSSLDMFCFLVIISTIWHLKPWIWYQNDEFVCLFVYLFVWLFYWKHTNYFFSNLQQGFLWGQETISHPGIKPLPNPFGLDIFHHHLVVHMQTLYKIWIIFGALKMSFECKWKWIFFNEFELFTNLWTML